MFFFFFTRKSCVSLRLFTEKLSYTQDLLMGFPCASTGKEPPAMWETWVWSLCWKDPLEKGKATHSSILAWRIPWTVHGVANSQTRLSDFYFHFLIMCICCIPLFTSNFVHIFSFLSTLLFFQRMTLLIYLPRFLFLNSAIICFNISFLPPGFPSVFCSFSESMLISSLLILS